MIRLRRYLVAGLLVWLPVGATILVFRLLLSLMERLLFWLPADRRPEALIEYYLPSLDVPGLNAIVSGALALIVLLATGMFAANLIGKQLVALYESWLARIPFVRTVYGAVKNFLEIVLSETGESFKRVLLIEYPRKGMYSIAFQTADNVGEIQERTGEPVLAVFLPTTPNPTSGYMLFVRRSEAVELDMPIEDALKMVVSLGVVVPKWHPMHPGSDGLRKLGSAEPGPSPQEPPGPVKAFAREAVGTQATQGGEAEPSETEKGSDDETGSGREVARSRAAP